MVNCININKEVYIYTLDPAKPKSLWAVSRTDAALWALAFIATLSLGVKIGIVVSLINLNTIYIYIHT